MYSRQYLLPVMRNATLFGFGPGRNFVQNTIHQRGHVKKIVLTAPGRRQSIAVSVNSRSSLDGNETPS